MPDDAQGTTTQTTAEGAAQATAQSAAAPQGQASPEDRFAAIDAKLSKLEGLEKEVHSLRTTNGRLQSQLSIATKNAPAFAEAFNAFEEAKATLLQQGYSEDEINTLAQTTPSVLKKLAGRAPEPPAAASTVTDEIKALRAELATLRGQQPGAGAQNGAARERMPGGGASAALPASLQELMKVDTRHMTPNQLREYGQKYDAALRAAGMGR